MSSSQTVTEKDPPDVDVAIIGGGIGGLAAAVALHDVGIRAHVYERTKVLQEIGGAVVIREPSLKLFEQWGVTGRFFEQAVLVRSIEMRERDGKLIRQAKADFIGDGDAYSVHRADIHNMLRAAVPPDRLSLGKESAHVSQEAGGARVDFTDGTHVRARLVIGADGIKSSTRKLISDDEMRFAGVVILRGIAPATKLPATIHNDRITNWGHGPRMMILLPLRGGNEVAMDTIIEQDEPPADLWNSEVDTQKLLDAFAGFAPSLLELIRAGTVPVRSNPVYDRDPIRTWSAGHVTLLGDAAHPMAPRMGQGANMAIQDAGALAASLAQHGLQRASDALRAYEEARVEPTTKMQLASRSIPETVNV